MQSLFQLTTSFLSKSSLTFSCTSSSSSRGSQNIIKRCIQIQPKTQQHDSITYPLSQNSLMRYNTRRLMTPTSSNSEMKSKTHSFLPTNEDKSMIQDMLCRIRECNDMPQNVRDNLKDFIVGGVKVGKVTEKVANLLCNSTPEDHDPVFVMDGGRSSSLTLSPAIGDTLQQRTDAVMSVMENLRSQGIIKGWRDELLPLAKGFYDEPVILVERAAAPFLGMQQYGVHINGIVNFNDDDGKEEKMWIARRSKTKSKYPGMLDHIVAGGQPAGLGLMENVLKECAEEAGIDEELTLAGIQAAGCISYEQFEPSNSDSYDGVVTRALMFNYDLYLPKDFAPTVVDGEVEDFFLWTIDEIIESMKKDYDDPIKPNCYLVIIDYLLRKGHLSPEIPGYLDIMRELRGGYCG